MPIAPTIPTTGLLGWNFLQNTIDRQQETFNRSPDIKRDLDYFNENAGSVETLDDLMGDRRLLSVALGAFGLGEEINKGAYVRKMLAEGADEPTAFAVRLANTDYLALASNFQVDSEGNLAISDTLKSLVNDAYQERQFEASVGEVDNSMRAAMNFQREIGTYAGQGLSEAAGWFRIMGSQPMREVIEGAFNLPSEFSALDIDRQREILADKSQQLFGDRSIDVFTDLEKVDKVINQYLLREQIENGGANSFSPQSAALSLLTSAAGGGSGLGSEGIFNLLLSNA